MKIHNFNSFLYRICKISKILKFREMPIEKKKVFLTTSIITPLYYSILANYMRILICETGIMHSRPMKSITSVGVLSK